MLLHLEEYWDLCEKPPLYCRLAKCPWKTWRTKTIVDAVRGTSPGKLDTVCVMQIGCFYGTAKNCDVRLRLVAIVVSWKTRKPCCRKETAQCRSYSFRFKVRRQHSIQVWVAKPRKPGSELQTYRRKTEFNAKWPFKVIQGHVFWSQLKGDKGLSNCNTKY